MFNTTTAADTDAIREALEGEFHVPGDAAWDEARTAWNLAVDQRPACIAVPANADDVVALVGWARESGLRIAVQATGHNARPLGDLAGAVLLKMTSFSGVEIDPAARIARIEGGVTWGEVAAPAAEHGLMALQGSAHDVGVVGYSLGGGVSFLSRKHGLAAERLRAVEIVTGDGVLRRVTADSEPDLFWALRGGGGNFGIVTAIEIELLERDSIYAGALFFPMDQAGRMLSEWRNWIVGLPEEMTSVVSLRNFPPMPELPDFLRGQSYAIVEAYWLGTPEEGDRLLAPLRALGPVIDTVDIVDPVGLLEVHMDPPGPVPGAGDHTMLGSFDEATIARLVEAAPAGPEGPLMVEIRHAGGALSRREEGCGALGAIEGEFIAFYVDILPTPELAPVVEAKLTRVREALDPDDVGSNYLNFAERSVDPASIFGERLGRLREIRDRFEGGLFQANHGLGD